MQKSHFDKCIQLEQAEIYPNDQTNKMRHFFRARKEKPLRRKWLFTELIN